MNQDQLERTADVLAAIRAEIDVGRLTATRTERAYIEGAEHALRLMQESKSRKECSDD